MATYLINASHEQKIATEEHGTVNVLVYSNPAYYESKSLAKDFGEVDKAYYESKSLAKDFGEIEKGDFVIICRDSKLKFLAEIEEVMMATDASEDKRYTGRPVKLLKGKLVKRFGDVGVGAATSKMVQQGIVPPNLINKEITGFKQGAFAEKLSQEQANHYETWAT